MIELLKQQLPPDASDEEKLNRVRDFLQLTVLKIVYDRGYFNALAFVGGTALRILFDLRRFSEDLDFRLIKKEDFDFSSISSAVERELKLYGLVVEMKVKKEKTVQSALVKFRGLLKELGLSRMDEQKLSIRIEIDTNPPEGWRAETTLVSKTYILNLVHFDLPSLYATKLHSCFFRKFVKGRDFYDFVWYLGKRIKPNFVLLNNAIKQTEGKSPNLNEGNFKEFVFKRLTEVDFDLVRRDVERFLEDKNELKLLTAEVIAEHLKSL